jgi:hypothetical protein
MLVLLLTLTPLKLSLSYSVSRPLFSHIKFEFYLSLFCANRLHVFFFLVFICAGHGSRNKSAQPRTKSPQPQSSQPWSIVLYNNKRSIAVE